MGDTLETVVDILDDSGEVDNQATFDALWSIMSAQAERITDHFKVESDPGYADLAEYGDPQAWRGVLNAYSGPEMDWMIHSWMGDPGTGFTNMHLTCWLGPHIDVPHLGFAWGTLPTLWFYQDYLPRTDLCTDYEYLQKYYEPTNERFLELKADEGLSYFTSRTLVVRQHVSETGYCFVCTDAEDGEGKAKRIDQIGRLAEQRVTDWLAMVDEAAEVPQADRAELADRDLHVRRLIAETDPANVLGERYYGEEVTARLVGALWGSERQLDRPQA